MWRAEAHRRHEWLFCEISGGKTRRFAWHSSTLYLKTFGSSCRMLPYVTNISAGWQRLRLSIIWNQTRLGPQCRNHFMLELHLWQSRGFWRPIVSFHWVVKGKASSRRFFRLISAVACSKQEVCVYAQETISLAFQEVCMHVQEKMSLAKKEVCVHVQEKMFLA